MGNCITSVLQSIRRAISTLFTSIFEFLLIVASFRLNRHEDENPFVSNELRNSNKDVERSGTKSVLNDAEQPSDNMQDRMSARRNLFQIRSKEDHAVDIKSDTEVYPNEDDGDKSLQDCTVGFDTIEEVNEITESPSRCPKLKRKALKAGTSGFSSAGSNKVPQNNLNLPLEIKIQNVDDKRELLPIKERTFEDKKNGDYSEINIAVAESIVEEMEDKEDSLPLSEGNSKTEKNGDRSQIAATVAVNIAENIEDEKENLPTKEVTFKDKNFDSLKVNNTVSAKTKENLEDKEESVFAKEDSVREKRNDDRSEINAAVVAKIIGRLQKDIVRTAFAGSTPESKQKARKFGVCYGSTEIKDVQDNSLILEKCTPSASSHNLCANEVSQHNVCSAGNAQHANGSCQENTHTVCRTEHAQRTNDLCQANSKETDGSCHEIEQNADDSLSSSYSRLGINKRKRSATTVHIENLDNCHKHKIKRLSLPDICSGCIYVTSKDMDNLRLSSHIPQVLNVDDQSFQMFSKPDLLSGGMVVSGELSRRISLPNFYTENDSITFHELPENFTFPEISPATSLLRQSGRVYSRSLSGGSLVEEETGRRVSLPDVYTTFPTEDNLPSPSLNSMSGGGLLDFSDTDHVVYSDILSKTVICSQKAVFTEAFTFAGDCLY